MLIALTGYAGAGKDTVGQVLVERHGFHRVSFAAALKRMALKLDPILELRDETAGVVDPVVDSADPPSGYALADDAVAHMRLSQVCHVYGGLEEAKSNPAVRGFLQYLGTEVVRETFGKDAWVRAARLDEALEEHGKVVITDCRFRNEAEAAKRLGGYVVRVDRPGVRAVNAHTSEHDLADWPFDYILPNAGGLEHLPTVVDVMLNNLTRRQG